ncbi:MAG: Gldg family protein [Eubacterium sp.]|nr:Gldg family protein [Eubacterium sp.]
MISIWKKELRSSLFSVVGFLYLASSLFFFGVYFYVLNLYGGSAHVNYAYTSALYLFSITVPILTMRSFAQEFRDRTDQLLFTAPVSLRKIVLGKYLACVTLFLIPVVVAAAFPVILTGYGDVAVAEAYTTLLAYVLYGLAAIAIGIFLSALTNNVVVAAVLTAVVLFLGYTMGGFGELLGVSVLKNLLGAFHLQARFVVMENGVISLRSVVYFLSIAVAFLIFTVLRLRGVQNGRGGNRIELRRRLIWLAGTVVLVIGLNVGMVYLPDSVTEHDVTMREFHLLTDQTKKFLAELKRDITIHVYQKESEADINTVKLLKNYEAYEHVTVEYVDPALSPRFPMNYTANGFSEGSLVVTSDTAFRVINAESIYTYTDAGMAEYGAAPDGFDLEGLLSSAIDYVTTERIPMVYEISGHGELLLSGEFESALSRENVKLQEISLLTAGYVPKDADCVLILAPREDYSEAEIGALRDYLEGGGHLYVMLQWTETEQTRLHGLLSEYGIEVENGIVSESDADLYFQEPYYLIPEILPTTVTEEYAGNMALSAMSVGLRSEDPAVETILKTTTSAFLKRNPEKAESSAKEEGDETGEFLLGVFRKWTVDLTPANAAEGTGTVTRSAQLTVFGSPYMTQDAVDQYVSGMNRKLFINIMDHMVTRPALIYVPAKSYSVQYVTVPNSDALFFGVILSGVIPGILLMVGVSVWFLRRRR